MSATTHMRAKSGRILLGLAGLVVIVGIALLAVNVAREIRQMGSAQSDNMQWALAQAEVEFLEYARLLDAEPVDITPLKRRFDVFYSRITTIRDATVFAELREDPETSDKLAGITQFLNASAAIIDQGDSALIAQIEDLRAQSTTIRPSIRQLAKSGLDVFARSSDAQRDAVAQTMLQLAIALAVLIGALFVGVLYLNRLNANIARRETAQAQTAARMNTVISTSLDAVIVSDESGRILEFNPAAEEIFGHKSDDVRGKEIGAIIVPDHMRDAHDAGMRRMQRAGQRRVVGKGRVQLEGKRANGENFPVELALQSAKTDDGEIFIAYLRDISKRVENEQALVEARDKALAGEKLRTDFLATMSHEIRTPLNGLLGNMNLLRDTRLSKEQDRFLGYMESSGRLLMSHISDVLDITRYDAGKLDTRREPVNLSTLLEDIVDNQTSTAVENETTLSWGWDGPPMHWIMSDHDRLQHVMMNLIGNAVKFTRRGRVSIIAQVEDGVLTLKVEDTGVGIDEDLLHQVFDDFVVGNSARNREVGGTGLGLGIAKRFVEALDGSLSVESTLGEGSTFTVVIPVEEAEAQKQPEGDDNYVSSRPLKVLLVEDNEVNRAVARKMIEADGHVVLDAHDGKQGVELAKAQTFDLVFMDINMPVMDGREATRLIRSEGGASAQTRIVALTANAMASDQSQLLEDGMDAVLTKPLSRNALRAALAEAGEQNDEPAAVLVDTDHSAETRHALGEQAFAKLRSQFGKEVDGLIEWFETENARDYLEVAARCHKIAGSAAVFGAVRLRETLKAVEDAAKTGDIEACRKEMARIPKVWAATKSELN